MHWPPRGAQHQLHCSTFFLPLSPWCRDTHKTLSSRGPRRVQPWDVLRPPCPFIGAVLRRRNPVLLNWMLRIVVVRTSSPSVARWTILLYGEGPWVRARPQSCVSERKMAVSHLFGCKIRGPNSRQHARTFQFAFTAEEMTCGGQAADKSKSSLPLSLSPSLSLRRNHSHSELQWCLTPLLFSN